MESCDMNTHYDRRVTEISTRYDIKVNNAA